ncbi:3-deoxy-7-phosphoheptulonate synthase [Vibrio alginolyticus]|uniref:3-deoxy-7-phosphoheptulonate synthase n=1 Tax=Vibrio alginolyticus TaxID=663 RepID=UPI003D7C9351
MNTLRNVINIKSAAPLPSLKKILNKTNCSLQLQEFITTQRQEITNILSGGDTRLLVIMGPCSIHDPVAAIEYAHRLAEEQKRYQSSLKLVMRTYFEKPRTRGGWKGFIVDPDLNGDFNLHKGINQSRKLMQSILELGVPTAHEFLDPNIAHYIADLVCWGAIGARTTESQPHRQLASGLLCPIGFKNGTDGNIDISIDAIHTAQDCHSVIAQTSDNQTIAIKTRGNNNCHVILRGGTTPNYSTQHIKQTSFQLTRSKLPLKLVVDCSHGNSEKIAKNQLVVVKDIANQISLGETNIAGVMCESFLVGGNQTIDADLLTYGQSITDECLSWQDSLLFLEHLNNAVLQHKSSHLTKTEHS